MIFLIMDLVQGMKFRQYQNRIESALAEQAGVVLLGPGRVGKTTLAQEIGGGGDIAPDNSCFWAPPHKLYYAKARTRWLVVCATMN